MAVLCVRPSPGFEGEVRVPGDKSITHRALLLGALAEGTTEVRRPASAEDCRSTAACLRGLGVAVEEAADGTVRIAGRGVQGLQEPAQALDCGNSGTTMRLLLGVLAGLPAHAVVTGDASLRSRPMLRVTAPLRRMGAAIDGRDGGARAPLAVRGGALHGIEWQPEVASAQVKSAILLAGLQADGLTAVVEPAATRDHTERMLAGFGAQVEVQGRRVAVRGVQRLRGQVVEVPADLSAAAFFLAAAAVVPGSRALVPGVGVNPTRTGFLDALEAMGADVRLHRERLICGEPVADVEVAHAPLHGIEVGGDQIPLLVDEVPILAVLAAAASGRTVIRDAADLRNKESDRLAAMAHGLAALGADVQERPDGLVIAGGRPLRGATVDAVADHRIAMSLAIAGLVASGETVVHGAESVAISFPEFAAELARWTA